MGSGNLRHEDTDDRNTCACTLGAWLPITIIAARNGTAVTDTGIGRYNVYVRNTMKNVTGVFFVLATAVVVVS